MPGRYETTFRGERLRSVTALHVHGMVCDWLFGGEEAKPGPPRPSTIGPFRIRSDDTATFEVTLLDDRLEERLFDHAATAAHGARLGRSRGEVIMTPSSPVRVLDRRRWDELWAVAPSCDLRLRFETPTTFRIRRFDRPAPDPARLLEHYRQRWLSYGPTTDPACFTLDLTDAVLLPASFDLRTRSIRGRAGTHTGFVGRLLVEVRPASIHNGLVLARLGAVAPYTGTGAHTQYGLGVTRVGWD